MLLRCHRVLSWIILVALLATALPAHAQEPAPPTPTVEPPIDPTAPPDADWPFLIAATPTPPPDGTMPLLEGDAALTQVPLATPLPQPAANPVTPPQPVTKTADPLPDVKLPSLSLDIAVAPDLLVVGETATFSVTVTNLSDTATDQLVVTVPIPDKVAAQSGPTTKGKKSTWRWEIGRLDAQAQQTVSATFKAKGALQGGVVVFDVAATASNMAVPAMWRGGALVAEKRHKKAKQRFKRNQQTTLQSEDGSVTVELPGDAAATDLELAYTPPDALRDPADAGSAGAPAKNTQKQKRRGLGAFELTATDPQGKAVHQFTKPLKLTLRYTPEQLDALGLNEATLGLLWFDDVQQQWVAVPSTVDPTTDTVTAQIDHFSTWQLGDQRTPSEAYVPSLQGFQTSLFTGAATYRMPIDVPAGPGGLQPDISLSYSSAATDGPSGERRNGQAGWVGKGWSLDAGGYVALNINTTGSNWNNFSLVFGGRSFDVVRGELTNGCTDYLNTDRLDCWTWNAVDENFAKVRAVPANGDYLWQVWTTDGTRYAFAKPARTQDATRVYVYKWMLTEVQDTHSNRITYEYSGQSYPCANSQTCEPNPTLWRVRWAFDTSGNARYQTIISVADRTSGYTAGVDTQWDYPKPTGSDPNRFRNLTPHEFYRVDSISVQSWPNGASNYQLVRKYRLRYASAAGSVATDDNGQKQLTLLQVQQFGKDAQIDNDSGTALPATTFTYGTDAGSGNPRPAGFNRLKTVDNGYGGLLTFGYDHPWTQASDPTRWPLLRNYHRLRTVLRQDTANPSGGSSALTTYTYENPAVNDQTNAATWWYARYSSNGNSLAYLAHPENWEFRGHRKVTEKTYNGASNTTTLLRETEHRFFQGDAGCTPVVTSNQVVEDGTNGQCFRNMRDRESWKGREYQTDVKHNGALLERTTSSYTRVDLPFYGSNAAQSGNYKRVGLWRAFNAVAQTTMSAYEGGGTPQDRTTIYGYDINTGNTTRIEERGETGATARVTNRYYLKKDDSATYMVDRLWGENVYDGAGKLLALTHRFFDNTANPQALPTKGDLTLERRYFDTTNLLGSDTRFGYDQYGNRTTTTTYVGAGSYAGSSNTPGNDSQVRTTTTEYDGVFHAFPFRVTNPLGHVETAGYDYRMGTITSVTDANGTSTSAEYDVFGRITKLTQAPDDPSYGTVLFQYHDHDRPVRYVTQTRGNGPVDYYQDSTVFYDGLGRQIHTKQESAPWSSQAIIADRRYDGLDRLVAQSQPRYVQEDGWAMWYYTTWNQPLFRPTSFTYDALDRPRLTTMPDNTSSEHHYGIVNDNGTLLRYDDVVDANRHRTQTRSDGLGRLVQAQEITGDCGAWQYSCGGGYTTGWAASTTTRYTYDALDQLKQTRDAVGNVVSMNYDSAGRKTSMSDPDMGAWAYSYDANGNLQTQRDARGQTVWFGYDALDRLISKRNGGSAGAELAGYAYDEGWSSNSKGRRTRMWTPGTQTAWQYDARGNTNFLEVKYGAETRWLRYYYDSANRLTTLNYVNLGEWVGYEYDMAGRPNKMCSSWNVPCYVSNATYNALGQMLTRARGDGKTDQWFYEHPQSWLTREYVGTGNHSYSYDLAGNVKTNTDHNWGQTQNYTYDHLDRLTHAWTTGSAGYPAEGGRPGMAYDQWYGYDLIGNLLSKAGVSSSYPAAGSARPHAPTSVGGVAYSYDANGNTTRTYQSSSSMRVERKPRWNVLNQMDQFERTVSQYVTGGTNASTTATKDDQLAAPQVAKPTPPPSCPGGCGKWVVTESFRESYVYDADGERVASTAGSRTTIFMGGVWEDEPGQHWRAYYQFNGQVVAKHTDWQGNVSYPLGDRLGSATSSYNASGGWTGGNEYDPWGGMRVSIGAMQSESRNYTGQLRDSSGLLYYHARYYDPALGRFLSPDTVVPGAANGSLDGMALKALTVSFQEPALLARLNSENKGGDARLYRGGPLNPQALNRYAYVLNNPVNATDPTGHFGVTITPVSVTYHMTNDEAYSMFNLLGTIGGAIASGIVSAASAGIPNAVEWIRNKMVPYGIQGLMIATLVENMLRFFGSAAFVATVITTLSAAQAGLAWMYGDNGLDVQINSITFGGGARFLPPTVERQHSVWVALWPGKSAAKICDCEIPMISEKIWQLVRNWQEKSASR